jgi:ADP-Ribosyltransferase in polyvalent proteins
MPIDYEGELAALNQPQPDLAAWQARQRGILGQVGAALGRTALGLGELPFEAASAIPGVRSYAEPVAQAIERAKPLSSGKPLETGIELGATGLGLAALTPVLGPGPALAITGALFTGSAYAHTRNRLEQLNETLVANGKEPLTTAQLHLAALGAGVLAGGGQLAMQEYLGGLAKQGTQAVETAILSKLLPAGAEVYLKQSGGGALARAYVEGALRDIPAFAGTAAGEALITRGELGPERVQTLEQAGVPLPTPGEAAATQVVPAALAAGTSVTGIAAARRVRQAMSTPGATTQSTATTASTAAETPPADTSGPIQRGQLVPRPPEQRGTIPGFRVYTGDVEVLPPDTPIPTTAQPRGLLPVGTVPTAREVAGLPPAAPSEEPASITTAPPTGALPSALEAGLARRGEAAPGVSEPLQRQQEIAAGFVRPGETPPVVPHPQTQALGRDILQALQANPYNQDAVDVAQAFLQETAQEPGTALVRQQVQQALQYAMDAGIRPTPSRVQVQATEPSAQVAPTFPTTRFAGTVPQGEPGTPEAAAPAAPPPSTTPPTAPAVEPPPAPEAQTPAPGAPPEAAAPVPPQVPTAPAAAVTEAAPPTPTPPREPGAPAAQAAPPAPGTVYQVSPHDLTVDPHRFQYKQIHTETGATGSLAGVPQFDPTLAGVVHVWRDPSDGNTYVVNGHNRVDLARRSGAPALNVLELPAADATEARAAGAKINIAEGQGTPIDAAKFFRDSGETAESLAQQGIPLRGAIVQQGLALARLNPTLFGAVTRGEFSESLGVLIGERLANHEQQHALTQLMSEFERKGRRLTADTVRELADMAASAPTHATTEMTLFGEETSERSLAVERAQLTANMRQRLAGDKRLFGTVGRQGAAEALSRAGNVIDVEQSQQVASQAGQALDIFDRLKNRSGPISDLLNEATQRIARGENATQVRNDLYTRLTQALPEALRGAEAENRPDGRSGAPGPGAVSESAAEPGLFGQTTPAAESEPGAAPSPQPGARTEEQPARTPTGTAPAVGAPTEEPGGETGQVPGVAPAAKRSTIPQRRQAIEQAYVSQEYRPEEHGSFDLSAIRGAGKEIGRIWQKLQDGTWHTRDELDRPTGRGRKLPVDQRHVEYLREQGELQTAWDQEGNSYYAAKNTPLRHDLTQTPEAPPGDEPLGKLRVTTEPAGTQDALTAEHIRAAFPAWNVSENAQGHIVMESRTGHQITIERVEQITPTTAELQLGYGQSELRPGEEVRGRITQQSPAVFRVEVTPDATTLTLHHEISGHFFEDSGLLTPEDIRVLNKAVERTGQEATPETRAEWLAEHVNARRGQYQGPLGQIIRTVQAWFDKLAQAVGIRTSGQVVRQIESGAVFNRTPGPDGRLSRLEVASLPRELETGPFRESQVRDEQGRLKAVYHGTHADYEDFADNKIGSGAGQMFHGLFFAEDPQVASHYATYRERAQARRITPEDLESNLIIARREIPHLEQMVAAMTQQGNQAGIDLYTQSLATARETLARLESMAEAGPNVRPTYLNIRKPFDLTQDMGDDLEALYENKPNMISQLREAIDRRFGLGAADEAMERFESAVMDHGRDTGADFYKIFARYSQDEQGKTIGVRGVAHALEDLGYDGLYHEGRQDGKVWVAFHPEQAVGAFTREARPGRLQVVNKGPTQQELPGTERPAEEPEGTREAPSATPRAFATFTPEIQVKRLEAYNSFANLLPPDTLQRVKEATAPGGAMSGAFRKEYIPMAHLTEESTTLNAHWDAHPDDLVRLQERMQQNAASPTAPGQASSAQYKALADRAYGLFLTMDAARRAGVITEAEFRKFEGQWSLPGATSQYATQALSEAGRTMRASQEAHGVALYQQYRQQLTELEGKIPQADRDRLTHALRDALLTGDPARIRAVGEHLEPPTLKDYFLDFYYGSLLYNPAALVKKVFSVTSNIVFHDSLVQGLGGAIDSKVAPLAGRDREIFTESVLPRLTADFTKIGRVFKDAWWVWAGKPEAATIPSLAFRHPFETESIGNPAATTAWARATWQVDLPQFGIKAGEPIHLMRRLAPIITASSRAFEAFGVGLRHLALDSALEGEAVEAGIRAFGSREAIPEHFIADWLRTAPTREPEAMERAASRAENVTFQNPANNLAQLLMSGRKLPQPLGFIWNLVMPFANTPANLLTQGMQLLPPFINPRVLGWTAKNVEFQGFLPKWNSQTAYSSPDVSIMLAKSLIGTVMTAGLYALWHNGQITGAAPQNPSERDAFYRQGKIPNAMEAGGQWISWESFHPFNLPLGVAVSAFDAMDRLATQHADAPEVPTSVVADGISLATVATQAMIAHVIEGSYFSGLASFIEGTTAARETGDIPKGVMRQIVQMVTPFQGLQKALIRTTDTLGIVPGTTPGQIMVRQPQTFGEMLANTMFPLPYTDLGAPVKRDIFGQPQHTAATPLEALFSPVRRNVAVESEVEDTFKRLGSYPGAMNPTDTFGEKMDRETYTTMVERRGAILQPQLERLVSQPGWARLTPDQQTKRLQNLVSAAGKQARTEVARTRRETAGAAP